jgi:hypothetical protein
MFIPALTRKEELFKKFSEIIYSEDYFYYTGYGHCHYLPEIKQEDNLYQWVSINDRNKICGYFAYTINPTVDRVYNFGMISFNKQDLTFAKDVIKYIKKLVVDHNSIEFRMIAGNPVKKHYDKFVKDYGGNVFELHDVVIDNQGNLRNEFIYEIHNGLRFEGIK